MLAVAALIVRIGHILLLDNSVGFLIEDSPLYLVGADWLLRTGQFLTGAPDTPMPETERMYGYFVLIAAVDWLTGAPKYGTVILQSLFDTGTVLAIGLVAARAGRGVGLMAGLLAAFWPNLVTHSGLILTDTMAVTLTTAGMLSFVWFCERPSVARALAVGATFSGSIAIRQGLMPLMPVIAAIMAYVSWSAWGKPQWRRIILVGVVPLVLTGITLAPQILRHWDLAERPVLTAQAGTHLLYWVAAEATSELKGGTRAEWARRFDRELEERSGEFGITAQSHAFDLSQARTELALEKLSALSPSGLAWLWGRAGAINLFAPSVAFHPLTRSLKTESFDRTDADAGLFARVQSFLDGQPTSYLTIVLPGILAGFVVGILSVTGFVVGARRYPKLTAVAVGYVAYVLVLTGPVIGAKYALPTDPILITWTALGAVFVAGLIRKPRARTVSDGTGR